MPFGISSAPEHSQKRMSKIISGLDGALRLMNDVQVFGKDKQEHDTRVMAALRRIETAGVTLSPKKCEFKKSQVKFLGHLMDREGIRPDPNKISVITEM